MIWLFLDNIVLGIDLFDSRKKELQARQKVQDLVDQLLASEKQGTENNNKWVCILYHYLENEKQEEASKKVRTMIEKEVSMEVQVIDIPSRPKPHDQNSMVNLLSKELKIAQKQNEILRKYLNQECMDHIETTITLDKTLEMKSFLEENQRKNHPYYNNPKLRAKKYDQEQLMTWNPLADKLRIQYYIRRLNFFAECIYDKKSKRIKNMKPSPTTSILTFDELTSEWRQERSLSTTASSCSTVTVFENEPLCSSSVRRSSESGIRRFTVGEMKSNMKKWKSFND